MRAFAFSAIALLPTAWLLAGDQSEKKVSNPHWSQDGCVQCHPAGKPPKPIEPREGTQQCLACHDGKHAPAEKHPVGRTITTARTRKPKGWPAPDNVLECLTCHDVRSACDRSKSRPVRNSAFLRGPVSDDRLAFCASCHVDTEKHLKRNPHRMLNNAGQVNRESCLYCHDSSVEQDRNGRRRNRPALVSDERNVCLGCHTRHIDYFDPGHVGAKKDGFMPKPSAALPLSAKGAVTCSTCHNPHQAGLFPSDSELARGAIIFPRTSNEFQLRGYGNNICRVCHEP
ncbi:MAG: hypothetical protein GXP29_14430 [Planctomycetes bacterium]|nr:hypothetical protein [Planctomycetota bacterium]